MVSRDYYEKAASSIAVLGRGELEQRIKNFKGRFKFDFTPQYLKKQSVDRLRHILMAAIGVCSFNCVNGLNDS